MGHEGSGAVKAISREGLAQWLTRFRARVPTNAARMALFEHTDLARLLRITRPDDDIDYYLCVLWHVAVQLFRTPETEAVAARSAWVEAAARAFGRDRGQVDQELGLMIRRLVGDHKKYLWLMKHGRPAKILSNSEILG